MAVTCWLVGERNLLVSCGDVLLERGYRIAGVSTPNPQIRRWAEERGVPVRGTARAEELRQVLGSTRLDFLFSKSLDTHFAVFIGEIGLTAEIRAVADLEKRLLEAQRLGFTHAYVPKANLHLSKNPGKMKVVGVDNVKDVFEQVMPQLLAKAKTQNQTQAPTQTSTLPSTSTPTSTMI